MDPYSILGVPKNCDRETLKQKYKKLALASHPDRGGSEALFKMIKLSYQKISEELKLRQIDKQFNQLKMDFKDHKNNIEKPLKNRYMSSSSASTTKSPPPNSSIPQSSEDSSSNFVKRFNKVFDDHKLDSPLDSGYAHIMEKSSSNRDDIDIAKPVGKFNVNNFNETFNNIRTNNTKQIMKYKEPEPTSMTKCLDYVELGIDHINDFSGKNECSSQSLRFMDYQNAHTTNKLIDPTQVNKRNEFRNVHQLETERTNANFDMSDKERDDYMKNLKKAELREQRRVEALHRQDEKVADNFSRINQIMIDYRT